MIRNGYLLTVKEGLVRILNCWGRISCITVACGLVSFVLPVQVNAQVSANLASHVGTPMPQVSYDTLAISGIEIIPGTSQEFEAILRQATDEGSLSSIEAIFPYSVMVRNNTAEQLIAITVRFYLTDTSGRLVWHQMTVGTRNNRPSNMIWSGDVALVTPETGLNKVLRQGVSMSIPDALTPKSRLAKHADLYSRQDRVRIAIDSVIFEDGGVVGPDRGNMLAMLNAWAGAEDTIADQVLSRHGSDIDAYLTSVRNAAIPRSTSLENVDHFTKHQREFAGELLENMKLFKTEREFFDYLQAKRSSRIPTLKRRDK